MLQLDPLQLAAAGEKTIPLNGQEFQRDHSTVVYSIKTMEENINRDQHLKEMCSDIMKNVRT